MKPKHIVLSVIGFFVFVFGTAWIAQGNDFFLLKVFAPKYEQVRRDTFEQSKAYNEGRAQELRRMQGEYIKATPEQRVALASVIAHQFADANEATLPPDVMEFLHAMRQVSNKAVR